MKAHKQIPKLIQKQMAETQAAKALLQQQLKEVEAQEKRNAELQKLSDTIEKVAILRRDRLQKMMQSVCAAHGVSMEELLGPRRFENLVNARDDVIRIMWAEGYSLPQIGRALGGRDHTTILHHCRKMGLEPVDNVE